MTKITQTSHVTQLKLLEESAKIQGTTDDRSTRLSHKQLGIDYSSFNHGQFPSLFRWKEAQPAEKASE